MRRSRWRSFLARLSIVLGVLVAVYCIRPLYLYLTHQPLPLQNHCEPAAGRADPSKVPRPTPDNSHANVKIIRLNEHGELIDRCDLTDAILEVGWDRLRDVKRDGVNIVTLVDPNQKSLPKFVVMYIHGWRHDGSEGDEDLESFRSLVARLSESNHGQRQVTGIYIGWPANGSILPFELLHFWSRMGTADRIAQSAAVTKIIGAIDSILSPKSQAQREMENRELGSAPPSPTEGAVSELPHKGNLFIAIGHSLGARLLFSATAQNLIYNIQTSHPGFPGGYYRHVDGMTDAIILLNPAFEASRYSSLYSIARRDEHFAQDQLPLLISVSTDNDRVTQWGFPAAQWLNWWTAPREIKTIGNYKQFVTHTLAPMTKDMCDAEYGEGLSDRYFSDNLCLHRIGDTGGYHNPLIVAQTNGKVIDGHSGIWDPKLPFRDWLFNYVDKLGDEIAKAKDAGAQKSSQLRD